MTVGLPHEIFTLFLDKKEQTDQPMSLNTQYKNWVQIVPLNNRPAHVFQHTTQKLGANKSHREMTVGLPHEIFTIFLDKKDYRISG